MKVKPLLQKLNSSTFLNDLLTAYGVRDVETYLHPNSTCFDDWRDYPDIDKGIKCLYDVITNNKKIAILCDCDNDGVMSAVVAYQFLKENGITPIVYFHKGKAHGIHPNSDEDFIAQAIEDKLDVLWIPDAGSEDVKECTELKQNGCVCLITDHHRVTKKNKDAILINHHLGENLNLELTGCGVTYVLIKGYCETYGIELGNKYLDLVACSIVSDIMSFIPLDNRAYLNVGLSMFEEESCESLNPMLQFMCDSLCRDKLVNPHTLSWNVVPKINALCRVDNQEAKEVFFKAMVGEEDFEKGLEVAKKAHSEQTKIVKQVVEELEPTLDLSHNVIIGFIDAQYKNFSGLIANRFCGEYGKPTFIFREQSKTKYSGSCRSPIPLATIVNNTGIAKCQGHEPAFGCSIKKSNIDNLIEWFDTQELEINPPIQVTAMVTSKQITTRICRNCVDNMQLWGEGIPEPTFYLKSTINLSSVNFYRKKTTTIKFTIDNMDFLKFRAKEEDIEAFEQSGKFDIEIIFTPSLNEWNGRTSVQGIVESYELKPHVESNNWEDDF